MSMLQSIQPAPTIQQYVAQSFSAQPGETANRLQSSRFTNALDVTSVPRETLGEKLFGARAAFKILTSQVAMHLPDQWREKLFHQIDSLLETEQWEEEDAPPSVLSSRTFLRLILALGTPVRPGLGATHDGNLVAAWTNGKNRLTVECLKDDRLRWSLVREVLDGDECDRAVGTTVINRFYNLLVPYGPNIWFSSAAQ